MTTVKSKNYRYQTVADELRSKILTEYRPGQLLAPERDLARHYSISHMTLRKVLDILADEGMVQRYRNRGTVVVDRLATGEFAIVLRPLLLAPEASPYYRVASTAIMDALHAENFEWNVRMHLGKVTLTGHEFPATLDLLEPAVLRNLRGVFSFHPLRELVPELDKALVPCVMLGDRGDGYRVWFNFAAFCETAVRHLKEVGCRSVGVLWQGANRLLEPHEDHGHMVGELSRKYDLECRPEWRPQAFGDITERSGYELFLRFWNQRGRPDGIILPDDILCRGVLRGILQLGISLPRDLRLVTMANHGVEFPYHLPITRFEYNAMDQAKEAVKMMMTLIRGKTPPEQMVTISGALVKGATT